MAEGLLAKRAEKSDTYLGWLRILVEVGRRKEKRGERERRIERNKKDRDR